MKKVVLLMLAVMTIAITSCSSDNQEESNELVGTKWKNIVYINGDKSKVETATTIHFTSSSSMTITVDGDYDGQDGFESHSTVSVPYSLNGSTLAANYNGYQLLGNIKGDEMVVKQTHEGKSETLIFHKEKR